ncbi:hypothetical protein D3C76_1272700 [compost metagenome]
MEKRPRQRGKNRRPAQQAEQRVDQAVFDVMNRCRLFAQVRLYMVLDRQQRVDPAQLQVQAQHLPWSHTLDRRPAQLAPQPGQDTQQVLLLRGVLR